MCQPPEWHLCCWRITGESLILQAEAGRVPSCVLSTHLLTCSSGPGPPGALFRRLNPVRTGLQTCLLTEARVVMCRRPSLTLRMHYLCGGERITSSSHENTRREHQITYLCLAKPESFIQLLLLTWHWRIIIELLPGSIGLASRYTCTHFTSVKSHSNPQRLRLSPPFYKWGDWGQ